MQTITRVFEFDTAHRVMNEKVKCFNLHGHRFKVEATFEYDVVKAIGYAIDFKELKRVLGTFIDEMFDHAAMLNPLDTELINLTKRNGWRLWLMGLGSTGDVNPSAENIASEIFYIANRFFKKEIHGIWVKHIKLYETPNNWVECDDSHYEATEEVNEYIDSFRNELGEEEYDIRNL